MATEQQFEHEDIARVPRGYKVRTIAQKGRTLVRVAFPPGPRRKGSGKLISILHPIKNSKPTPKSREGPVQMTKAEYLEVHKDYRSTIDGKPYVLTMQEGTGATVLAPVQFVGGNPNFSKGDRVTWETGMGTWYGTVVRSYYLWAHGHRRPEWDWVRVKVDGQSEPIDLPPDKLSRTSVPPGSGNPKTKTNERSFSPIEGRDLAELLTLWRMSQAYETSRYKRMQWTSERWAKSHPGETMRAYKTLDRVLGNPREKTKTREQVEAMQAKAVRFLEDVVEDSDKAGEIERLSLEDYAAKKKIQIENPRYVRYSKGSLAEALYAAHEVGKPYVVLTYTGYHTSDRRPIYGSPFWKIEGEKVTEFSSHGEVVKTGSVPTLANKSKGKSEIANYQVLKAYKVRVRGGGKEHTWIRFAPSLSSATLSAREAVEREFPSDGKLIEVKQTADPRANRRCNPDDTAEAARLYEEFHGKSPEQVQELQERDVARDTFTALGGLLQLRFNKAGDKYKLDFTDCKVRLASSQDGGQLYLIGGDQNCDALLKNGHKDFVSLGVCDAVTYVTRKGFDKFKESAYQHKFGEEGGEKPWGLYNTLSKRIFIVDGSYRIEAPGIID